MESKRIPLPYCPKVDGEKVRNDRETRKTLCIGCAIENCPAKKMDYIVARLKDTIE